MVQAFDQERACWIGQGRQALQHQRGQLEVAAQQYEEANRQQLHHAVEHANTTANVELTQGVQTLASSSEARFSTHPRQLLSRLSTEPTQVLEDQRQILVREALAEITMREEQSQIIHEGARGGLRQELRASQQALTVNAYA